MFINQQKLIRINNEESVKMGNQLLEIILTATFSQLLLKQGR